MATRSRIGLELKSGQIASIYCHWDGYPEYNGRMLRDHFDTSEKVRELIDGGDVSALYTNVGWQNETLPTVGPLYYSSRGEDCPPRLDNNLSEFLQNNEEFGYVFTESEGWLCYDTCEWHDSYMEGVKIPAGSVA